MKKWFLQSSTMMALFHSRNVMLSRDRYILTVQQQPIKQLHVVLYVVRTQPSNRTLTQLMAPSVYLYCHRESCAQANSMIRIVQVFCTVQQSVAQVFRTNSTVPSRNATATRSTAVPPYCTAAALLWARTPSIVRMGCLHYGWGARKHRTRRAAKQRFDETSNFAGATSSERP